MFRYPTSYYQTKTEVKIYYKNSWKFSVSKDVLDTNIRRALSPDVNSIQRIRNKLIVGDIKERASFIFDGLRGLPKWNVPSGAEINPYSIFNKGFSKSKTD
jgi:hypothetical protein